jgi:hypothetical protein
VDDDWLAHEDCAVSLDDDHWNAALLPHVHEVVDDRRGSDALVVDQCVSICDEDVHIDVESATPRAAVAQYRLHEAIGRVRARHCRIGDIAQAAGRRTVHVDTNATGVLLVDTHVTHVSSRSSLRTTAIIISSSSYERYTPGVS